MPVVKCSWATAGKLGLIEIAVKTQSSLGQFKVGDKIKVNMHAGKIADAYLAWYTTLNREQQNSRPN